jgi:hypothetical protein
MHEHLPKVSKEKLESSIVVGFNCWFNSDAFIRPAILAQ